MIPVRESLRVAHIAWVLVRHGLDEFILAAHLFRPIRFFRFLFCQFFCFFSFQ